MGKFLLCEQIFEDNKGLNNHYKIYVEEDNFFYKDLFVEKKDKGFIPSLWPRCDQFLEMLGKGKSITLSDIMLMGRVYLSKTSQ